MFWCVVFLVVCVFQSSLVSREVSRLLDAPKQLGLLIGCRVSGVCSVMGGDHIYVYTQVYVCIHT